MRITGCIIWMIGPLVMIGALAYAAPSTRMLIKVLSSEQWSTTGAPAVARDCNWRDISAYCTSSIPETYVEKSMLVQDMNGRSLRIACTVLNQWSSCANLPIGQTFQAWQTKHALVVRYADSKGKQHNLKYDVVEGSR